MTQSTTGERRRSRATSPGPAPSSKEPMAEMFAVPVSRPAPATGSPRETEDGLSQAATDWTFRLDAQDARRLFGPTAIRDINEWLRHGDGVAIYENVQLSHPEQGHWRFASFGSPGAQLAGDQPPSRPPAIDAETNDHYRLVGTYRNGVLSPIRLDPTRSTDACR